MKCQCGQQRVPTEARSKGGWRRIEYQCHACYRRDIELRTSGGALIRWRHDVFNPTYKIQTGDEREEGYIGLRIVPNNLSSSVGDRPKAYVTITEHKHSGG